MEVDFSFGAMDADEKAEASTYRIYRTGSNRTHHYQLDKCMMGIVIDQYWVELRGRLVQCSCQGFLRQQFPKIEHKHVKMAFNYQERNEPYAAEYRIHGSGARARIEHLQDFTQDEFKAITEA